MNATNYGGSGNSRIAITSRDPGAPQIVVHETGHTFASLADEYTNANPGYTNLVELANATAQTNRSQIRWGAWILSSTPVPTPEDPTNASVVGLFQGAQYQPTGWYRPRLDCKMRTQTTAFCEVCSEALVEAIYQLVRPIDGYAPPVTNITFPRSTEALVFTVALQQPATLPLGVQWFVNGTSIGGPDPSLVFYPVLPNAYTQNLQVVVRDYTPLVRNDPGNLLTQSITWQILRLWPWIQVNPVSQAEAAGSNATFSVVADGLPPPAYQWLRSGTNLIDGGNVSGATTVTLTLSNVSGGDAASYSVVVSNSSGAATSFIASLSVVVSTVPGAVDTSFWPGPSGANDAVFSVFVQSDGKVLIGGLFTSVNGVTRNGIARLNADGSLDASFGAGLSGANGVVYSIALQSDGKPLIGGAFTSVNGVTRNRVARLNADGSLDSSFGADLTGASGVVYALALQSDGKPLIGGAFTTVNSVSRRRIARLNTDGSLDATFGAPGTGWGASAAVRCVAVQSDGKVLIGGQFLTVNSVDRPQIARLNPDGSLDVGFVPGLLDTGSGEIAYSIGVQADGKVLLGGFFTAEDGVTQNGIARLNADGSLDGTFGAGLSGVSDFVISLAVQSDGKALIGGAFTDVNGVARNRIARLNADGSLDTSFGAGLSGANNWVYRIALQSDANVVIGGGFTIVNNAVRPYVARLFGRGLELGVLPSSPSNVTLFWPSAWSGFSVQRRTDFALPWSVLGQPALNDGTNWTVTVPATNACQFYRLRGP